MGLGLGLWCLTPLSIIFQLYRVCRFYWKRKPEYPENITQCIDKLYFKIRINEDLCRESQKLDLLRPGRMAICEFGVITRFLHRRKTGLDNFMAICEFGNESGGGCKCSLRQDVWICINHTQELTIFFVVSRWHEEDP